MTTVVFRFDGAQADALERKVDEVAERANNARPVFERWIGEFETDERNLYATEGHGYWKPNSKPYAAWKAREHPGMPLGVLSGRTRDSLTGTTEYSVREITDTSLTLGTSSPAALPQKARGKDPIAFGHSDRVEWVAELRRYIVTGEL